MNANDRLTAADGEHTIACPDCDTGGQVYPRQGPGDLRCAACGATFEEAVEREKHPDAMTLRHTDWVPPKKGTIARKLWDSDPDIIGGAP